MTKRTRAASHCRALESTDAREPVASVELITTLGLAVSTVVAVTAVSIGIARADVFGLRPDADTSSFAIGLLIGFALLAMGGLTAVMADSPKRKI